MARTRIAKIQELPENNAERCRRVGIVIGPNSNISIPTDEEIREHNTEMRREGNYLMTLSGDSAWPEYHDGDTVLFNRHDQPKDGDFVHCVVVGSSMLKQYLVDGDRVTLHSINPEYIDLLIKPTTELKVLGVALAIVSRTVDTVDKPWRMVTKRRRERKAYLRMWNASWDSDGKMVPVPPALREAYARVFAARWR